MSDDKHSAQKDLVDGIERAKLAQREAAFAKYAPMEYGKGFSVSEEELKKAVVDRHAAADYAKGAGGLPGLHMPWALPTKPPVRRWWRSGSAYAPSLARPSILFLGPLLGNRVIAVAVDRGADLLVSVCMTANPDDGVDFHFPGPLEESVSQLIEKSLQKLIETHPEFIKAYNEFITEGSTTSP